MKYIKHTIKIAIGLLSVLTSCDSTLEETPDNRTFIDSPDKIGELLVGAYPDAAYVSFLEPMSDNAADKGPNANTSNSNGERINREMFYWRDLSDTNDDTPTNYWNRAYKAIAQANQALASIEELGDGADLSALKGEALICRAYAHFMLVSIFSKAYNPITADSDLGIPYVTEPEDVLLQDYKRGSVANVYNHIKSDIEEAMPLIKDKYKQPTFHFTAKAANAFAARFYLNIGEWEKVIEHSTVALSSAPLLVLRDWEGVYSVSTYSQQGTQYTAARGEPANLLVVTASSSYNRFHASARYQLNTSLVSELFNSRNVTGKGWSMGVFGSGDLVYNVPKFREYFKVTNQAAGTGIPFVSYVLFSTDEALMNRAEAYAMLGQLDNAVADLNLIYTVYTENYDSATDALTTSDIETFFKVTDVDLYTPFYAIPTESLAYVNAVLSTKRTIFYNDGLRWFDIKRHHIVVNHEDYYGNEFILEKGDNRRAIQIPEAAKSFGVETNLR